MQKKQIIESQKLRYTKNIFNNSLKLLLFKAMKIVVEVYHDIILPHLFILIHWLPLEYPLTF